MNKPTILVFSMFVTILKVTVMVPVEVKSFVMEFELVLTRKKNKGNNIFRRRQSVTAESVSHQEQIEPLL